MAPAPLDVGIQTIHDGPVDFVASLPGDALLIQTATVVSYSRVPGATLVDITAIAARDGHDIGDVIAATGMEWGRVLIASTTGFFMYDGARVEQSPLGNAFPTSRVRSLLSTPGPTGAFDLWVGLDDSLHRWRAGQAVSVTPGALPVADTKLAFGAPLDGAPAVWVASGETVYAIVASDEGTRAQQALANAPADALAVNFEGFVWLASQGKLRRRDHEGAWWPYPDLPSVTTLAAHPDAHNLWISTVDGVWHHSGGELRPVEAELSPRQLIATSAGTAIIVDETGVRRIFPGRTVEVSGMRPGALLVDETTLTLEPPMSMSVQDLTATLDDQPVTTERAADNTWTLDLDPAVLLDGTHELRIEASYGDGAPSARALFTFFVYTQPIPKWTTDIEPLFDSRCSVCHGLRGSASKINTRALWQSQITRIISALEDGRMPLPPNPSLTTAEIDKIKVWQAASFPE